MAEHEESKKHLVRDVLRVVRRHWRIFALTAMLTAVAVLGLAPRMMSLEYTGEARLTRRLDPAAAHLQTGGESVGALQRTLRHELAGREAVERAVDALGWTANMPKDKDGTFNAEGQRQRQALVRRVTAAVRIRFEVQSAEVDIVSVSYTDANPERAEQLPNELVRDYVESKSGLIIRNLELSKAFLEEQVKRSRDLLTKRTGELTQFLRDYGGMALDSPGTLPQQTFQLETDIQTLQRQTDLAQRRYEQLRLYSPTSTTQPDQPEQQVLGRNPEHARLSEQLRAVEDQLADARTIHRMRDTHPTIQMLEEKKLRLTKSLDTTPELVVTSIIKGADSGTEDIRTLQRMQFEMQLSAAEADLRALARDLEHKQTQRARLDELMKDYDAVHQRYQDLRRLVAEATTETNSWQGRLSGIEMTLAAEVPKRRTLLAELEMAERQFRPSSPTLGKILGMALFGGLALGGGVVFLAKMLDRSIQSTEDAEQHFDVPVCGAVGEITTPADLRVRRVFRWGVWLPVWTALTVLLALLAVKVVIWLNVPGFEGGPLAYIGEKVASVYQSVRAAL